MPNIGKQPIEGIGLVKFNVSGEIIEFEIAIRPIKALQALGEEIGTGSARKLAQCKAAGPSGADFGRF